MLELADVLSCFDRHGNIFILFFSLKLYILGSPYFSIIFSFLFYLILSGICGFFVIISGAYENKRENQVIPSKYITLQKHECGVRNDILVDFERN